MCCLPKCLKIFFAISCVYLQIVDCACTDCLIRMDQGTFTFVWRDIDPPILVVFKCWWKTGTSGLLVNSCVISKWESHIDSILQSKDGLNEKLPSGGLVPLFKSVTWLWYPVFLILCLKSSSRNTVAI